MPEKKFSTSHESNQNYQLYVGVSQVSTDSITIGF